MPQAQMGAAAPPIKSSVRMHRVSIASGDSNETVSTPCLKRQYPYLPILNSSEPLMRILKEIGYESPSPIQSSCIPLILAGGDINRQDCRLCAADLEQDQHSTNQAAGFGVGTNSRVGDPGCRASSRNTPATRPASTCCRFTAVEVMSPQSIGAASRRSGCRRRHTWSRISTYLDRKHAGPVEHQSTGAR